MTFVYNAFIGSYSAFSSYVTDMFPIMIRKPIYVACFLPFFQDHLPPVLDSFRPSLVLYDAGVDVHKDDQLGKLKLTDGGIAMRDRYVINQAWREYSKSP